MKCIFDMEYVDTRDFDLNREYESEIFVVFSRICVSKAFHGIYLVMLSVESTVHVNFVKCCWQLNIGFLYTPKFYETQ